MDQFSAHLDRGWDLVQTRRPTRRRAERRRALEIDSQSPEAHNLLGYVAALKGESTKPSTVPPGHRARRHVPRGDAERGGGYIHPLGVRRGHRHVRSGARAGRDRRRGRGLPAPQVRRAARQGRADKARRSLRAFPAGPFENPNHMFLVGRAYYEIGDVDRRSRSSRRP